MIPHSQAICHSHVFFYTKLNPAEFLCVCKCPLSVETLLGLQSSFSQTRMIGFRDCHRPQKENKQHTHSPGPWHTWPWPSAAGKWWVPVLGQHPSQLTSIPVSELPLHSHGSSVGGHCLHTFTGIECLGNIVREGLPQNTVMLDMLASWHNSTVCLESSTLMLPCLRSPHLAGNQPIKTMSLFCTAEYVIKNQHWFS